MTAFYILIAIIPVIALGTIFGVSLRQKSKGLSGKKVLTRNLASFALVLITICALTFTVSAAAESADAAAPEATSQSETAEETAPADNSKGLGLIAAAIVTGISGVGGGIAVAAAAPAAIAATSENDKSFGKSLIFVALGESIALYGVVISILILNKV